MTAVQLVFHFLSDSSCCINKCTNESSFDLSPVTFLKTKMMLMLLKLCFTHNIKMSFISALCNIDKPTLMNSPLGTFVWALKYNLNIHKASSDDDYFGKVNALLNAKQLLLTLMYSGLAYCINIWRWTLMRVSLV